MVIALYRLDCITTLSGLDDIPSSGCPWRYVVGTTSPEKKRHTGALSSYPEKQIDGKTWALIYKSSANHSAKTPLSKQQ